MNIDQIAMCYISMDLSQRALPNNGKLCFKLVLKLMDENQIFFKQIESVNIDQSAMCYILMDSS